MDCLHLDVFSLTQPQVMANIMTANFSQLAFIDAMRKEVGHTRGMCPYESFICLNSGSECVSLAMRIADIDSKRMTTGTEGPHAGRETVLVSLKGSFHGRTERPAHASDSSRGAYRKHLKSFSDPAHEPKLYTVEPNCVCDLRRVFKEIDEKNQHVELMLMEPVMGEGNPGMGITREFYDEARLLTDKYRSLLLVDSIQAGLRAHGTLSIMDYPGFQDASPPDFETYSKAINGGQYPLSILALGPRVPEIYARGLYGNTMTTNPRALDIATAVLTEVQDVRQNITEMGKYFQNGLKQLTKKHPDVLDRVSGTGLLVAAHLKPQFKAYGDASSLESVCRKNGLGVIHGGKNALRFTPYFYLKEVESDMLMEVLDESIAEFKHDPKSKVKSTANSNDH
jgi:4-aminobutyrate aminotransferase-like enzyme